MNPTQDLSQVHFLIAGDKVRVSPRYHLPNGPIEGVVQEVSYDSETANGRGAYKVIWCNINYATLVSNYSRNGWFGRYFLELLRPAEGNRLPSPQVVPSPMGFQLNREYLLGDTRPEWVKFWKGWSGHYYHVPTEVIVTTPGQIVSPLQGRFTVVPGVAEYNGVVATDSSVCLATGVMFTPPGWQVIMAEVFHDQGDDGHTRYELTGYAFYKSSQFMAALEQGRTFDYATLSPLFQLLYQATK